MKIWITGAAGLLGKALAKSLERRGICFAASTRQDADVTNLSSLLQFYRLHGPFTHIIHAAAYTKVDLAQTNPDEARRVNGLGSALIGLVAAENGCKLIALSTDYVFDGSKGLPYLESDPISPQNIYGKTKAEGEERLLAVCPNACVARTSWLFGEGGKHFVSTMMGLMKEREEIRVVSDQRGRPTYSADLAEWLLQMLDVTGIVHLANAEETSWYEFAKIIHSELVRRGPLRCTRIVPVTTEEFNAKAKRPLYSVLDTSKAERRVPLRPWQEGLRDYLRTCYETN